MLKMNLFTEQDLLRVRGDFRYAVGRGRTRWGRGGSMGRAIRPRVRGSGRSEDSGIEGCQDGRQNIEVFTGWLSPKRVCVQTCDLGNRLTRVPTWRGGVQPSSGVSCRRELLLLGLLGDWRRRGGGGGLVRERGLAGRQGAEPLATWLGLGADPVGLKLLS